MAGFVAERQRAFEGKSTSYVPTKNGEWGVRYHEHAEEVEGKQEADKERPEGPQKNLTFKDRLRPRQLSRLPVVASVRRWAKSKLEERKSATQVQNKRREEEAALKASLAAAQEELVRQRYFPKKREAKLDRERGSQVDVLK